MHAVRARRLTRPLALVGPVGLAAFVLAVAALHGLRSDLSPLAHTISEYSLGDYGWLMHAAFTALGVGVLATAWSVRIGPGTPAWRTVAAVLLASMALGLFLDAAFNTDHLHIAETIDGTAHGTGTWIAVLALPLAAFVLGSDLKQIGAAWSRARWLQVLALAQLLAIMAFETSPLAYRGLAERIVMVTSVVTLAILQSIALSANDHGFRNATTAKPQIARPVGEKYRHAAN